MNPVLSQAYKAHVSGERDEARRLYELILGEDPDNGPALYLLALLSIESGRPREGLRLIERLIRLRPGFAEAYFVQGLGLAATGSPNEALEAYDRALAANPRHASAYYNRGNLFAQLGRPEEALEAYERALGLAPDHARAHNNRGNALQKLGRREEALKAYQNAIQAEPALAEAHYNRAIVLKALNRFTEAVAGFRDAIRHDPRLADAYLGCAETLTRLGRTEQALNVVKECSEHHPGNVDSIMVRAQLLRKLGRLSEGLADLDLVLRRRPDLATAHNDRGNILKDMGRLTEALKSYRLAMSLRPDAHQFHSNLILVAHYDAHQTQESIAREYQDWNRRHIRPLARPSRSWPSNPPADGKLRIGLVSGSFRRHPIGYFVLPVLEHRDKAAWHVTAFSSMDEEDDLTARIRHNCDSWMSIASCSDHQAAQRIREGRIDILLAVADCSSHGRGGRPLLFAHRPAPVQVAWAGLFDTTGIETMDYLLADAQEVPADAERWYSETVYRLPDGYVCYAPPSYAPPVGPLPWQMTGQVTFGCFNAVAKLNDHTLALWARVLRQVTQARLILKNASFSDPAVRNDYTRRLIALGIEPSRFQLRGPSPHQQLLATYNEIDIALDPFPYSGGLTTCESLWMGVPVLTLPGPTFAGRHSASHSHNVGLPDWVAADADDFVMKAHTWTRLAAPLAVLRAHLRDCMAASPLCNADRYCRNLEAAIAEIWRRSGPYRPAAPHSERMS